MTCNGNVDDNLSCNNKRPKARQMGAREVSLKGKLLPVASWQSWEEEGGGGVACMHAFVAELWTVQVAK